ncbi:MAG TPA: response regulator [Terriglobales bacterium]|nr:response regulator [Terriglobales bacterium]
MDKPTSKTLLFAEDEPELLEIYTHWFQRLGYNVRGASNGNQALEICRTQPIDLVVSDVRMAGGDGITLARELRTAMDASPLLVFLTGFADLSNEEAYDLGACSILSKPINRDELRQVVERFLKPPRELWSVPLTLQLNTLIEKRYQSLADALGQRALSFGRGGMFVRGSHSLPEDVPIGFQFRFTEGDATRMYGSGILRWQRPLPHQNLPAGMGIEILHLDSEALDPVVQWISDSKPRAFIPKE